MYQPIPCRGYCSKRPPCPAAERSWVMERKQNVTESCRTPSGRHGKPRRSRGAAMPAPQETIRSLQVGDTVDINISSEDTRWNNVQHAVGAMYWILKDGKVDTSISDGASAPRTAVGVKRRFLYDCCIRYNTTYIAS